MDDVDRLKAELAASERRFHEVTARNLAVCHEAEQVMLACDQLRAERDELIAELAIAPLTWTRERPTEPGWYWMRRVGRGDWGRRPGVVSVEIYPNLDPKDQVVIVWGTSIPPIPPDAEWAGPIPEPAEKSPDCP